MRVCTINFLLIKIRCSAILLHSKSNHYNRQSLFFPSPSHGRDLAVLGHAVVYKFESMQFVSELYDAVKFTMFISLKYICEVLPYMATQISAWCPIDDFLYGAPPIRLLN